MGQNELQSGLDHRGNVSPDQSLMKVRGEIDATLHGELSTILGWIEAQTIGKATKRETPAAFATGVSVSLVAGTGFEPVTFRL
jgi:hypothetical protein